MNIKRLEAAVCRADAARLVGQSDDPFSGPALRARALLAKAEALEASAASVPPLNNSRKVSAMNERQLEIASQAVSEVVQSASYGRDAVKGEELKALAVSVSEALVAGFEKLGVVS